MLDYNGLVEVILRKKGVTEETPFGPEVKVLKVMGKMFLMAAWLEKPLSITIKCDPDDALMWRARYSSVTPGYYMNKKHWNTVVLDGSIPDNDIWSMIEDSYQLVVRGLKKSDKEKLNSIN
jgi:predicted DNA-binding protein (MmcQ/YjbR family)